MRLGKSVFQFLQNRPAPEWGGFELTRSTFRQNPNMMKHISLSVLLATAFSVSTSAQVCNPSGNVVVYSNYDGGIVTINCDLNIPNLKIGVCTYEAVEINITGPFAGNVTEVLYAGYIGENDNCGLGVTETTISGVSPGITDILFAPPVTQSDANGYPYIICGYSCGTGNQGGCNTSNQIAEYFTDTFGGSLYLFDTHYNCWQNETVNLTDGGSCCPAGTPIPQAYFTSTDQLLCIGQCIDFNDGSSGGTISTYAWSFGGANILTSSSPNPTGICYLSPGVFPATLTVSNGLGSTSYTSIIEVIQCGTPGCTYPDADNYNASATTDDGSCLFSDCANECPADLDGNGIINVSDLLEFMAAFGTICPQ